MGRVGDTLGRDPHEGHGDPGSTPTIYRAEVTAITGSTVSVVVLGYSGQRDYDQVEYMPRGSDAMTTSADCRVAFDDDRNPFIVWWKP
jgi:hypothetical protein